MSQKMRSIRIQVLKNKVVLADQCHVAESYFDRLRGLIGRSHFATGEAMLFPKCNSVHSWWMRFEFDVVFLRDSRVTSVHSRVKPWKIFPIFDFRARETLELPAGTIEYAQLVEGDKLCLS